MRYERTDGKLVAEYIRILKPTMRTAMSKTSKPATPAASKTEGSQKSY
jgi:hypothetical protein